MTPSILLLVLNLICQGGNPIQGRTEIVGSPQEAAVVAWQAGREPVEPGCGKLAPMLYRVDLTTRTVTPVALPRLWFLGGERQP